MKTFPNILNVENKDNFNEIYYNRVLCYLRRDLYEHILCNSENSYFDLDKFTRPYKITEEQLINMTKTVMKELEELSWKCKLSFQDTGLFIYSSEKPPVSCWEDDL